MFRKIHILSSLAWVALASTAAIGSAHAANITYTTPTGSTGSDGAVSASATFTTSDSGLLTVVLTNTLSASAVSSPGQALSDLSFTLSSNGGTLGTVTASGQQGTVDAGGSVTLTSGSPGKFVGSGGGTFSYNGTTFLLEAIGGGTPSEMILPSATSYPNANGGLINNFDPYTIGPATFTFLLSGVSSTTTITSATFSFGTSPDTFIPGTPGTPPVPEPTSLALFGTGIAGLSAVLRRRFKVQTS